LAKELRRLPDLTNVTAVAKIAYLALNATNPEVKEAFELMIKGGTPDPKEFSYAVPNYNTELQVLYWLACQNELKRDDTLALAVAMVNGLWVTMGNEQIRQAVHNDTNALLRFGRETSDWQRGARLRYNLEDYPLEAKVAWAWTGSGSAKWGVPKPLRDYVSIRPSTEAYELNTVSPDGLSAIREYVLSKDLEKASVLDTVDSIETFAWSKLRAVSYPYEKDPQGYVFNDNADYLFHLLMSVLQTETSEVETRHQLGTAEIETPKLGETSWTRILASREDSRNLGASLSDSSRGPAAPRVAA